MFEKVVNCVLKLRKIKTLGGILENEKEMFSNNISFGDGYVFRGL